MLNSFAALRPHFEGKTKNAKDEWLPNRRAADFRKKGRKENNTALLPELQKERQAPDVTA